MAEISTIARPYAVAAYQLAKETQSLEKWSEMLGFMSAVVSDSQMQSIVNDPKITSEKLLESFLKVCGEKITEQGQNLVKVLVEYGRMEILPAITAAFEVLKAQDEGVLEAQIISAINPTTSETQDLITRLETKFGKKINVTVAVKPEILGGFKIIVGDTVIDASVQGQLQNLAYTLAA